MMKQIKFILKEYICNLYDQALVDFIPYLILALHCLVSNARLVGDQLTICFEHLSVEGTSFLCHLEFCTEEIGHLPKKSNGRGICQNREKAVEFVQKITNL